MLKIAAWKLNDVLAEKKSNVLGNMRHVHIARTVDVNSPLICTPISPTSTPSNPNYLLQVQ
jgi:hypothetical protein